MIIHRKIEEKVRDIDYKNTSINRLIIYSNLLIESNSSFRDNAVTDLAFIDSMSGIKNSKLSTSSFSP